MPTTLAKLVANRQNARLSTGPRTPEGKARASQNARTHGLLSGPVVLPDECPDEFATFAAAVADELRPVGPVEHELVALATGLFWRLRRVARVEAGLFVEWQCATAAAEARARARALAPTSLDLLVNEQGTVLDFVAHADAEEAAAQAEAARDAPLPRLARAFVAHDTTFATLSRYEAAMEARAYRALRELRQVQDARVFAVPAVAEPPAEPSDDGNTPDAVGS